MKYTLYLITAILLITGCVRDSNNFEIIKIDTDSKSVTVVIDGIACPLFETIDGILYYKINNSAKLFNIRADEFYYISVKKKIIENTNGIKITYDNGNVTGFSFGAKNVMENVGYYFTMTVTGKIGANGELGIIDIKSKHTD